MGKGGGVAVKRCKNQTKRDRRGRVKGKRRWGTTLWRKAITDFTLAAFEASTSFTEETFFMGSAMD